MKVVCGALRDYANYREIGAKETSWDALASD